MNSGFDMKPIATIQFKPGSMTLGDLGKHLKPKEDGGFTLSFPSDVVESSSNDEPTGIYSKADPAAAGQPAESSASARPQVLAQIDEMKNLPIAGIKHTTRGLPRTEYHQPESPKPFSAGRFQIDFERREGPNVGMIFQTEAGPGHLANVVPGETPISGGSISFLSNPDDSHSISSTLNKAEEKALIESLYGRFTQKMTAKQATLANNTISYAMAVHFKEGGQGSAVQSAHSELSAAVKAQQPSDAGSSNGGWGLRG